MPADELLVILKDGPLVYHYSRDPASAQEAEYRGQRLLELLASLRSSWKGSGSSERLAFGDSTVLFLEGRRMVLILQIADPRTNRVEHLARALLRDLEARYGERVGHGEVSPADASAIGALLAPLRDF